MMESTLTPLETSALVTAVVTGVGGFALGIYNAIQSRADRRPHLRVEVSASTMIREGPGGGAVHDIELLRIVNRGRVPVVASTIGFELDGDKTAFDMNVQPTDSGGWPRELAPGHHVMVKLDTAEMAAIARENRIKRVFVTSAADDTFRSTRKGSKAFQERLEHYARKFAAAEEPASGASDGDEEPHSA